MMAQRKARRSMGESEDHSYTYQDLSRLTGKKLNTIYQHVARGTFDPNDLGSVVKWVARHGKKNVKREILDYALSPRPDESE